MNKMRSTFIQPMREYLILHQKKSCRAELPVCQKNFPFSTNIALKKRVHWSTFPSTTCNLSVRVCVQRITPKNSRDCTRIFTQHALTNNPLVCLVDDLIFLIASQIHCITAPLKNCVLAHAGYLRGGGGTLKCFTLGVRQSGREKLNKHTVSLSDSV